MPKSKPAAKTPAPSTPAPADHAKEIEPSKPVGGKTKGEAAVPAASTQDLTASVSSYLLRTQKSEDEADAKLSPFLRKQKKRLLVLRDAMLDSMSGVAQDNLRARAEGNEASAFGMHQADAGSDAYDPGFRVEPAFTGTGTRSTRSTKPSKRIELGTYGTCEMSGKPINHERLEAIPFTRFTVESQSQLERQNKGPARPPVRDLAVRLDRRGRRRVPKRKNSLPKPRSNQSESPSFYGERYHHPGVHRSEGRRKTGVALRVPRRKQEKPEYSWPTGEKEVQSFFSSGTPCHRETRLIHATQDSSAPLELPAGEPHHAPAPGGTSRPKPLITRTRICCASS